MSDSVFVFVDESGSHTETDFYVVAGCWCVTSYTDVNRILQPTKNRLSDNVFYDTDGPSIGREIKGSQSANRTLDSALLYLRKIGRTDGSITSAALPWDDRLPVRFTTYESDSDLSIRIARRYLSEGRTTFTTQVIALCALLSPMLYLDSNAPTDIESVHVVLDSDTWKAPSKIVKRFIDDTGRGPAVEFSQHDSRSVPGIQLADVAAYVRRQRIKNGACVRASEALDEMRM